VLVHGTARYVVRVRARFRLHGRALVRVCVCMTAMYVARVRSGVRWKSDISGMRLALVGKITNTNHRITSNRCSKTPRFHAQFGGVFDICLVFDRLISMPKPRQENDLERIRK
jgi:hypothetical protein